MWAGALAAMVLLAGIVGANAGPWPQAQGHGLLIESFGFLQAQNYAGVQNPAYGNGAFRRFEAATYAEYGLTDRITLVAAGGAQLRQLDTGSGLLSTSGIGDIDLSARATVWQTPVWAIATQGIVKVPTGYDPNANPALGNDQVDLEPRLLAGRGFWLDGFPAFADLGVGYRFRTGAPSDQVRIDATFGVFPATGWMILLQSFNIVGMQNQAPNGTDFNLSTLRGSVVRDLSTHWSVELGVFSEIASRNYNRGNGIFGSIWWKF